MEMISVSDLAQSWYREAKTLTSGGPDTNELFQMLYNAHRRHAGLEADYQSLTDHHKACTELYRWYVRRYSTELGMPLGSKGQSRTAGKQEYTFDLLYCDDRQFKKYLMAPYPMAGNQDLLAFVLHTAVAFLVPLEELDQVLQRLGFHPLHVKNLHHLSIACVLLSEAPGGNPFARVRALYTLAQQLMEDPNASAPEEGYRYTDAETKMIRADLVLGRGLTGESFTDLVVRNRELLNMRHSTILRDFHRLSAVFLTLYDRIDTPEQDYSFHRFLSRFCQEKLSRKKYRDDLTFKIDLDHKHPTRSILILLWLYTCCFEATPGIYIDQKTYGRLLRQLQRSGCGLEKEAERCYDGRLFDVYGFLMQAPERTVPDIIRFSKITAFLNDKLFTSYGWGQLNDKLPFDHYIRQLDKLTLRMAPSGLCTFAEYDGAALTGLGKPLDNVPYPLVALTQLMDALAQLHGAQAALHPKLKLSPCPLKCSLYEQL